LTNEVTLSPSPAVGVQGVVNGADDQFLPIRHQGELFERADWGDGEVGEGMIDSGLYDAYGGHNSESSRLPTILGTSLMPAFL
jgi:hypothetical protein